ncbi:hypothetical protein CENSYa_1115 [Cenarchaeum symbiosum A]|uniref:Uncharacterized protein n=1 Tax=Cenarchaeum symbiosum (strain A) TaxID=414004 RepID=A0RWM7_CENSY|nr:hypothetical protein CENSYa_1115 [Cenarchaeum symbiosum A]
MASKNTKSVGNKRYEYYEYHGRQKDPKILRAGRERQGQKEGPEFELEGVEKRIGIDPGCAKEIRRELERMAKE